MKNLKFTFWLIGFGCGIVISGIIGALFTINVDAHENSKESIKLEADQLSKHETERVEEAQVEMPSVQQDKKKPSNVSEQREEKLSAEVSTTSTLKVIEQKYCELEIPKNANATQICQLLQEKNVIRDSEEFLEYIKSKGMQNRLRAGKVRLPELGEYETILDTLIH